MFNDNIDENQTTTNHHGLQDQGMRPQRLSGNRVGMQHELNTQPEKKACPNKHTSAEAQERKLHRKDTEQNTHNT